MQTIPGMCVYMSAWEAERLSTPSSPSPASLVSCLSHQTLSLKQTSYDCLHLSLNSLLIELLCKFSSCISLSRSPACVCVWLHQASDADRSSFSLSLLQELVGFNLAALRFLQDKISERHEVSLFAEAYSNVKDKKQKRKKRRETAASATVLKLT